MTLERILGIASVVPVNGDEPRSYRVTLIEAVVERLKVRKGDRIIFMHDEKIDRVYIEKA